MKPGDKVIVHKLRYTMHDEVAYVKDGQIRLVCNRDSLFVKKDNKASPIRQATGALYITKANLT